MRQPVDRERALRVLREIARRSRGAGRIYAVGGTSAVIEGWRDATVDVDLVLDPEPAGAFEAIRDVKRRLAVSVELASPADFVPELPGWRDRSMWIDRVGQVDLLHYDFTAQALSKIERGHAKDLADVHEMVSRGLVEPARLQTLFDAIRPAVIRYPALDENALANKVAAFVEACTGDE